MTTSYVTKVGMSEWESADSMDQLAHGVTVAASSLAEVVSDQDATWQSLGNHYEGDGEGDLVNGFFVPVENAARVVLAAEALDKAFLDFSNALRGLWADRRVFETEVDTYNSMYGAQAIETLPPGVDSWRAALASMPADLERRYQQAASTCASAVRTIDIEALDLDSVSEGRPGQLGREIVAEAAKNALPLDPENPSTSALGLLDVARVREPWLRFDDVIPETWQARFMGLNVGPLGASVYAGGAAMVRAAQTRSWAPLRNVPLAMSMTMRNYSNDMAALALRYEDPRKFRRPTWPAFKSQFLDGLPVTGFIRSTVPLWGKRTPATVGAPAPAMAGAYRVESRGAFRLNAGVKGLGAAGTLVGAGLTYRDEYDQQLRENQAETPGASREEVESEARQDAGAQTAGNVLSTIAVSAGTGALAGSVLPGPGNVVGFAAGVVSGVAMAVPVKDTDGDGQKDSVAEVAGDLAEGAWNWIRGR
ncbi:hypothetical protein KW076_01670 [Micrococcus porci]|uniref:hypothetical protein n=1 Tax=Micrococcus porci TaxID=2856555 RepID=UPI001CC9E364|nr:hypothetical protein [Micrococcus porci]UBH24935.1 hypothetical protein KW076_01670 [Micrococcus porci]